MIGFPLAAGGATRATVVSALLVVLIAGSPAAAQDAPSTTTTTTGPSTDWTWPADPADLPFDLRMQVDHYMAEYGVSEGTVREWLEVEDRLLEYATKMRGEPGYASFKLVRSAANGVSGVLAVTADSRVTPPPDLPVTIVYAKVTEQAYIAFVEGITTSLHDVGWTDVSWTHYDPYEDVVTVWMDETADVTAQDEAAVAAHVEEFLGEDFAETRVRFETASASDAVTFTLRSELDDGGRLATAAMFGALLLGLTGVVAALIGALRSRRPRSRV